MEYFLIGILVFSVLLVGGLVAAQSGVPPAPGREAPAFDLPDSEGRRHAMASCRGRRAVVFFFPMDDTPECLAVVAAYQAAQPRIEATGARFLAVAVASPEAVKAYREAQAITFPDPRGPLRARGPGLGHAHQFRLLQVREETRGRRRRRRPGGAGLARWRGPVPRRRGGGGAAGERGMTRRCGNRRAGRL
ncbi:MAG: redoxin domain-containing protein [Betaproteobacteria bacterium]|nr:redoxin domain-containing protein [Betaproteobacteria bacterium]